MSLTHIRQTSQEDNHRRSEDTFADLLIYSGAAPPSVVTNHLGLDPTYISVAPSNPRPKMDRVNGWFLSSDGKVTSKDLRQHLDWLLEILSPLESKLRELQQLPEMRMGVTCVWFTAEGQGGPTFWPEQMRQLADLNLECSFSVYFQ